VPLKKNIQHPAFIIGLISFILLIVGAGIRANSYSAGDWIFLSAVGLGAIHWIWAIIDVIKGYDLNPDSKTFWLILVILIPPMGGMLYYMMKRKNVSM
jgi:hypothetical protein